MVERQKIGVAVIRLVLNPWFVALFLNVWILKFLVAVPNSYGLALLVWFSELYVLKQLLNSVGFGEKH